MYSGPGGRLDTFITINPSSSSSLLNSPTPTGPTPLAASFPYRPTLDGTTGDASRAGTLWPGTWHESSTMAVAYHPAYNHSNFDTLLHPTMETTPLVDQPTRVTTLLHHTPQAISLHAPSRQHRRHNSAALGGRDRLRQTERGYMASLRSLPANSPLLLDREPSGRPAREGSSSSMLSPISLHATSRSPAALSHHEAHQEQASQSERRVTPSSAGDALQLPPAVPHHRTCNPNLRDWTFHPPLSPPRSPRRSLAQTDGPQEHERLKRRRISCSEEGQGSSTGSRGKGFDAQGTSRGSDVAPHPSSQPQRQTRGRGKEKTNSGCLTCRSRRKARARSHQELESWLINVTRNVLWD
ncbi:hypothetical protein DL93DRAFT_970932 [Clavulina sp. PMI_390]|nr:hypothetical protein DL93DRAFT_970932 [Clavulina sp. PMI_390]